MKKTRKLAITMMLFISLCFSQIIAYAADSGLAGISIQPQTQTENGEDTSMSSSGIGSDGSKEDEETDMSSDNDDEDSEENKEDEQNGAEDNDPIEPKEEIEEEEQEDDTLNIDDDIMPLVNGYGWQLKDNKGSSSMTWPLANGQWHIDCTDVTFNAFTEDGWKKVYLSDYDYFDSTKNLFTAIPYWHGTFVEEYYIDGYYGFNDGDDFITFYVTGFGECDTKDRDISQTGNGGGKFPRGCFDYVWTQTGSSSGVSGSYNVLSTISTYYSNKDTFASGCNFKIVLCDTVTKIPSYAFYGITEAQVLGKRSFIVDKLIIPDTVTYIGDYAFYNDKTNFLSSNRVGSIILSNAMDLTYIGDYAFYSDSHIDDIDFENLTSLEYIGNYAFYQCYPSSYYDTNDPSWDKTGTPPLVYKGFMGDLAIPDSVTYIGNYAFYGCWGIENLSLGNRVETIGDRAFSACSTQISSDKYLGLSGNIIIPDSVTYIGDGAFSQNHTLTGDYIIGTSNNGEITHYGSGVTSGTRFEGTLSINTLKDIPNSAFVANYNASAQSVNYNNFTYLLLGDEVRTIGSRAFENHDFRNEVLVIPDSVTSIGDYAFQRSNSVYYQRNPILGASSSDSFTYESFKERYVNAPKRILHIGDGVETIGQYTFSYNDIFTRIEIGKNVSSIGNYAFQYCYGINEIDFSNSLETIGNGAFQNCINLRSLRMTDHVKTLSQSAFSGCINLESVDLNHVEELGNQVFFCNYSLKDVDLGDSINKIGSIAFGFCPLIKEVHIPNTVETLTSPTFNYCLGIKKIIIDNLDNFENFSGSGTFFQSSPNCTEIILPDQLSVYDYADVGYNAFNSAFQVFNSAEYSLQHAVYLLSTDAFTILSPETQSDIQAVINAANEARLYGQETKVTATTAVMNDIVYSIRPDDPYYITYDHNGDSNDTKNVWYTMLRVPVVINLHYKNGGTDNVISFKEFDTEYWKQNGYKADRNGLTGDQIDFIEKYDWGYMDGDGTWNVYDLDRDVSQIAREDDTDLNKGMELNLYRESFQVTFVTDPEATQIDPQVVESGELVSRPEDPLKDGFAFVGWYTEPGYENKFDFNTPITEPKTLYAKFMTAYAITYDLQGGKEPVPANPTVYAEESDPITLRQPTKIGYTFTGWSGTDLDGDDNLEVIIPTGSTGNREYTANWKANPVVKNDPGNKKGDPSGGGDSSNDTSDAIDVNVTNTIIIQDDKLPQTGQNWVLVLVFAVTGGSLILVGALPVFKKQKTGFPVNPWFLVCGCTALTIMAVLVLNNHKEDIKAGNTSSSIMTVLHDIIGEEPDDRLDGIDTTDIPDIITVDNVAYLGYLELPSLGIELPVSDDWSYPLLKQTPCRYYGTVYTRDMVVCAHNYQSHFGNLNKLNIGDVVTFTDANGHLFDYTVSDIDTLDAYAVGEMTNGEHDLTLFTCTIGGQARVTVRCDLISDIL